MDQPLNPNTRLEAAEKVQSNAQASPIDAAKLAADVANHVVTLETNSGAADVMSGMEGNEVRETNNVASESKADPVTQQTPQQSTAAANASTVATPITPPTQQVIVRTVKLALVDEMKKIETRVRKLQKNAIKFAHDLAEAFEKLRNLRNLLREILTFTREFLELLYAKVMHKESLTAVQYIG